MKLRATSLTALPCWQIYGLSVVLIALVTAGGWAVSLRPMQAQSEHNAVLRDQLQEEQQTAARLTGELVNLGHSIKSDQQLLEKSLIKLESSDKLNQRLAALASLAGESGLRLDEIQSVPGNTQPAPSRAVSLRVTAGGNFRDCTRFLHRLHQQYPDIAVKSFECVNADFAPGAVPILRLELEWATSA